VKVSQLIEELQKMPPHAEVRVCSDEVGHPENDEATFHLSQINEAEPLSAVVYEGQFVGLYA
jgi:hypothetical protein